MNIKKRLKAILLILPSLLYGIVVRVRNFLFDKQLINSESFHIPIISIGNITVGGTGKTPHIEYLIRLLQPNYRLAVLSRGYRRHSKGFVLADIDASAEVLGDEPYQIYTKFPTVIVAVCEKRVVGIKRLLALPNPPEIILLDDAFQHRHVKPSYQALLVDYNRPLWQDHLLPWGGLREPKSGIERADAVIVTKCPDNLTESDLIWWRAKLELKTHQPIYFSTYSYNSPEALFPEYVNSVTWHKKTPVLVVTGVVSATGLYDFLSEITSQQEIMPFADHHYFTQSNFKEIIRKLEMMGEQTVVVVTEKDAARLINHPELPEVLKSKLFMVRISVRFLLNSAFEPQISLKE